MLILANSCSLNQFTCHTQKSIFIHGNLKFTSQLSCCRWYHLRLSKITQNGLVKFSATYPRTYIWPEQAWHTKKRNELINFRKNDDCSIFINENLLKCHTFVCTCIYVQAQYISKRLQYSKNCSESFGVAF